MFPKQRVIAHNQLLRLKQHLKKGGVCAYPTEFCFGLGGLPTHPKAIRTILRLKKRPAHKGLIVISDNFLHLKSLVKPLNTEEKLIAKKYWPGANTLLLPVSCNTLHLLRGTQRTKLAVRVTDHSPSRWFCQQLNTALISTSANIARAKPIRDIRNLRKQFSRSIWIINAPLGKNKQPSKIIDIAQGLILRK